MDRQTFIYKFLITPQLRVWRYLTLIVFFTVISLNQAFVGYMELIPQIGNDIYLIVAITVLVYLVSVFNFSRIASKYLLSGKYLWFLACIIVCAILFVGVSNTVYYLYMPDYDLFSEFVVVDNLSAFSVYLLCISGVVIPIFLKKWVISNQHLNQLKIKQESSQVEQFKEQINPPSFFKILGKSRDFVKTEPDRASAMLMKLGQLLRYQLYDCNREQVLLSAEISFLRNFLELEKLCSSKFDYSIEIEDNINGIFVYPSVILPYVQSVINTLDSERASHSINIQLSKTEEVICIVLATSDISNNISLQKELTKVRERLETLYKDCYKLTLVGSSSSEVTEISLQLKKG